ncbi:hypothetical protein B7H23_10270 [Notoacmeibacter marinus]|uniref:Uncharacterized protein n=1 Tax=Notoacmeibacter marinus TaxID=1876515 RepID=A0A231UYS4_9HYPH|nr:hypothetical protein B7H23_10270 [Notoacmeibacter marinus]
MKGIFSCIRELQLNRPGSAGRRRWSPANNALHESTAAGGRLAAHSLPYGNVAIETRTDRTFEQDKKAEEDLFWWNSSDEGFSREVIEHTHMKAGGGIRIEAGDGVVVEYEAQANLDAAVAELSTHEGLEWMGDLKSSPNVDWRAVRPKVEDWDYEDQGLTQAGAALVALVVSTVTSGVGGSIASGLGFAQGTIVSAAMEAGFTSLATQTSISLINNQGDIGATLKELGSEESIRTLVGSMLTAGLTQGVLNKVNIPATSIELGASQNFANAAQRNLLRAAIKVGVQSTVEGRALDDSLVSALRLAAADTLGATLATEIGRSYHTGQINKATQLIAHAALGCATGAVSSGACASGASGAVVGEVAAELHVRNWTKSVLRRARNGELTREQLALEIAALDSNAIDVATLTGGLAAAVLGGDVNAGASAGGNAAQNNFVCGGLCVAGVIIGAGAIYSTIVGEGNPLEGLAQIGSGSDPLSAAISSGVNAGIELSLKAYPGQTLAALGVLEAIGETADLAVTYAVADRRSEPAPHRATIRLYGADFQLP